MQPWEGNQEIWDLVWDPFGFPSGSVVKNPPAMQETQEMQFNPWVGKIPWRRPWQPTQVFLPGESHGQRGLVGYSPVGHKESDTNEATEHTGVGPIMALLSKLGSQEGRNLMSETSSVLDVVILYVTLLIYVIHFILS